MISSLLSLVLLLQAPNTSANVVTPAVATPTTQPVQDLADAVLVAPRHFVPPAQPLIIRNTSSEKIDILLVDFIARNELVRFPNVEPGDVDIKDKFSNSLTGGSCYLLLAVKPNGLASEFIGTPLVLTVRADTRRGAASGPMVYTLQSLQYAKLTTTAGAMSLCFYYDTAPITTSTIQRLMAGGFYDGLDFFRIEPGFVIQTGDPRNDGTGGPGFSIGAEFSDRQHLEGVVSLARATDPNEAPGLPPRSEYANSGGSQFFFSLSYDTTRQLDRRYTTFGRVVRGIDTLRKLAASPLEDKSIRPRNPVKLESARLVYVTRNDNPYAVLRVVDAPTTDDASPTTMPATTLPTTAPASALNK